MTEWFDGNGARPLSPERERAPVVLETVWAQLESIATEMRLTLIQTAFSTGIRAAGDCACALFDLSGRMIAQSSTAPGQIGSMPYLMQEFMRRFPGDGFESGDVYISNHPWLGCGHTPDIYVVAPVFHGEELVAFGCTSGHHSDIGGRLGSQRSEEVYEEGLLIPPIRLVHAGVEDAGLVELLRLNSRLPDELMGDLRAQMAATFVASRRLAAVLQRCRLDGAGLTNVSTEIISRSEAAMRRSIASLPDGESEAVLELDDVDQGERLVIKLTLRVAAGEIWIDYNGTSPQVRQPINSVLNYSRAYSFVGVKMALGAGIPTNIGAMAPVHVEAPSGTIVNPRFPAPVRWRTTVGLVLPDVVFKALARIAPDRVTAGNGTVPRWHEVLSGESSSGRFILNCHFMGGLGAMSDKDGLSCVAWPANIQELSTEEIETTTPLRVGWKRYRSDSGGSGEFRGGLGQEICLENPAQWGRELGGPVTASVNCGRYYDGASGLLGGAAGARGEILHNALPVHRSREELVLLPGDRLVLRTPGGGGYGIPSKREESRVAADVECGFVSPEMAEALYASSARSTRGREFIEHGGRT